jgi:S-formylglutathione hydrolase FrmB
MHRFLPALVAAALCAAGSRAAEPLAFHLTFDPKAHPGAFTGRVYVLLFANDKPALASGPDWINPEPFFARDVKGWQAGQVVIIDRTALGHPATLDRVAKGTYTVQAVMDVAPDRHGFTQAPGNVYTVQRRVVLDPASTGPVKLKLDRVWQETSFKESERVKLVEVESKLLTAFRKRPTRLRAAVLLPASHAREPGRKYPVVYEIPGFGGNHRMIAWAQTRNATNVDGVDVIHVMLDPDCHHGHHVFADSASNGPCGKALVEEVIPAIEKRFRGVGKPAGRFVTGHSSGGWSSLWLQVAYPDFFGGCWSTSPDPVDFRDFQRINLYRPGENMFTDRDGNKRPIARRGGRVLRWYRGFSDMEEVMGHGGQLASFEAVFSARGPDGQPRRLWDRKTGAIDPEVAKSWEKYDIRLVLERNWKTLGPKLAGKLHVYMGEQDNFYLEGATRLLGEALKKLGSDAKVEVLAGYDHSSLLLDQKLGMHRRIGREMAAKARAARLNE